MKDENTIHIVVPKSVTRTDRTYRLYLECDETRQRMALTVPGDVGIPKEEIRNTLKQAFDKLLNHFHLGIL